jgi:hypothetical protein
MNTAMNEIPSSNEVILRMDICYDDHFLVLGKKISNDIRPQKKNTHCTGQLSPLYYGFHTLFIHSGIFANLC